MTKQHDSLIEFGQWHEGKEYDIRLGTDGRDHLGIDRRLELTTINSATDVLVTTK